MYMLSQYLLFISLNLYHTKVHVQHHEYIMIYIIFTIYYNSLWEVIILAVKKIMSRYSSTFCMKIHQGNVVLIIFVNIPVNAKYFLKSCYAWILKVKFMVLTN